MVSELGRFERPRTIRVRAVLSQVAGALFLVLLVAGLIALVNRVQHRVVVTSEGLVGWRLWGPRVRARWDEVRAAERWSWVDGEKVRNPSVREAVRLVGPRMGRHVTAVSDMEHFDRFVALVGEHAGQVPRWGPSWVDRVLTWPDGSKMRRASDDPAAAGAVVSGVQWRSVGTEAAVGVWVIDGTALVVIGQVVAGEVW